MPPIEELKKHLLCPNYRNILDEHGKPVPPKSFVYKEISSLLNNALSPKYIYTILITNRYGVHDTLLAFHGIEKPCNVTASSIDDDESLNQSISNTEINFSIKLPPKTWHDIDCEKVIYNVTFRRSLAVSVARR
jgi:hypothetical protein